jgi:hypothetical protein
VIKVCDQIDCPLHPDYTIPEPEKKAFKESNIIDLPAGSVVMNNDDGSISSVSEDGSNIKIDDTHLHVHSMNNQVMTWDGDWTKVTYEDQPPFIKNGDSEIIVEDKGIKMKSQHFEGYAECLFCTHRKQHDIKREIIALQAKKLLEE